MSKKCDRCHEAVPENPKLTSESEPYCSHCGFVFGTSVQPSVWICDRCGRIGLHHGGDCRPWCTECDVPKSAQSARPSRIHGAGVGDADLDYGLAFLMEAQELEENILFDMEAQTKRVTARSKAARITAELKLGQELLLQAQTKSSCCDGCQNLNTVLCLGSKCRNRLRKLRDAQL